MHICRKLDNDCKICIYLNVDRFIQRKYSGAGFLAGTLLDSWGAASNIL